MKSSDYREQDIAKLSQPVVREITYRVQAISLPFFVLPVLLVTWVRDEWLVLTIGAILSVALLGNAILLLHKNTRLFSPISILNMLLILYLVQIFGSDPVAIYWGYSFAFAFFLMLEKKRAIIANIVWTAINSLIAFSFFSIETAVIYTLTLASTALGIDIQSRILSRHESQLKEQALRDPLTNTLNRRAMLEILEKTETNHRRYGTPASIILMDLDHFKSINDQYGHTEGDKVLVNLAELLSSRMRATDELFRFGGEEFLILLPATPLNEAITVAQSYHQLVKTSQLSDKLFVTASMGVAQLKESETVNSWLKRCDSALYQSKHFGRDQVTGDHA